MARDIIAQKSYRTIVGTHDPESAQPAGCYLLDSNDTAKYYALFIMFNGEPEKSVFAQEFMRKKFALYQDINSKGDLSRPQTFLREAITELQKSLADAGLGGIASSESLAVVLVREGVVVLARVNACPVFFIRDRKFRQIFTSGKSGGAGIDIEAYTLAHDDRILVSSEDLVKRLAKLELRSIISTERDLDLSCSKIMMLASRYEEVATPKLLLIGFTKKHEESKALLSRRNIALLSGLALFMMVLIFWHDVSSFIKTVLPDIGNRISLQKEKEAEPRKLLYQFELVFDGLTVPYDVAVDTQGILYVVDDKETQVIRYDPTNERVSLLGNGISLIFPTGIDIADNRLYITDFANTSNTMYIVKEDGEVLARIKTAGEEGKSEPLRKPKAVTVDKKNQIWVADRGNNRLVKYNTSGAYTGKVDFDPKFKSPNGLAFGPGNDIFVTFKESNQIAHITRDGKQNVFNIYRGDNTPGNQITFNQPAGIAVDNNGYVYIADRMNFRIIVTDPRGKVDSIIDQTKLADFKNFMPFSLKVGPDGKYLYIVGSTHLSYDDICRVEKCRGKIWRMRI